MTNSEPADDPRTVLRDRLLDQRQQIMEAMLRDGPTPGWLAMMTGIGSALDALDAASGEAA